MLCPYILCVNNTIGGSCRWNGDPETCAFGRHQKEIGTAHKEGVKEGLNTARRLIGEAMAKQG